MERRFKFAFLILLVPFLFSPSVFAEEVLEEEQQAVTDLDVIAERMRFLSGGLGEMPVPPKMDEQLQIPDGPALNENEDEDGGALSYEKNS